MVYKTEQESPLTTQIISQKHKLFFVTAPSYRRNKPPLLCTVQLASTMASTDQSDPTLVLNSKFLDLPLELREEVYNFVWRFEDALVVPRAYHKKENPGVRNRSRVSNIFDAAANYAWQRRAHIVSASSHFLRCSKQVYAEGMKTLYGNQFTQYVTSFPEFATQAGQFSFSHIRHFELSFH